MYNLYGLNILVNCQIVSFDNLTVMVFVFLLGLTVLDTCPSVGLTVSICSDLYSIIYQYGLTLLDICVV